MLSAKVLTNAQQAEHYFSQDNYYTSEEGFEHSAWAGKGAAALGLSGGVHREQFMELLQGKVEGQELGKMVRNEQTGALERDHRPGVDMTFSAPKSVSLLAEVAGDERVQQAHDMAVMDALAYLERVAAQARTTTGGITTREDTGNLVAATFRHDTSRELDPNTHTHAVIMNITKRADGKWRSVTNEELLGHIKAAGAMYRASLAERVSGLGYEIERTHSDGRWEVKGFTKTQLDHFSQRSGQIEQALEARGKTRATATTDEKQTAALDTRKAKKEVDRGHLHEEWLSRAKDVEIDWDAIPRNKAPTFARESSAELYLRAKEAVEYATQHLSERQSSFAHKDLYRAALEAGIGRTTVQAIDKAIKEARKTGTLIDTGNKTWTTRGAVTAELRMVDALQRSKGNAATIAKSSAVQSKIAGAEKRLLKDGTIKHGLNAGQQDAAKLILGSTDRYVGVQGYAGTGKTTMLSVVKAVAEDQGYQVIGLAQSASAAETLQSETGIKSQTIAGWLLAQRKVEERKQNEPLPRVDRNSKKPVSRDVMGNRYLEIPGSMFRQRQLLVARGTIGNSLTLAAVDKLRAMRPEGILAKAAHSHAFETAKGMVKWERANTTDHVLYRTAELASKVTGLFQQPGKGEAASKKLIVVDEASLASQKDVNRLMAEAEKLGAKVVFTGDSRQLSAVSAGKPFELLQERGMQTAHMTEIHRQTTDPLKQAVASIIERREQDAFQKLEDNLVELRDNDRLTARIVADVRQDVAQEIRAAMDGKEPPKDTLIITALNADRQAINGGVRQALKEDGVIAGPARDAEVLVNRALTKAQSSHVETYQNGDVVRFGRDYKSLGVTTGQYARVTGVDAQRGVVQLQTDAGAIEWRPPKQSKVEVYRAETRELQTGDKIRFTRNDKDRGLNNGDVGYVKAIDGHKAIVQVKGKTTTLDLRQTKHWDYAYASTIHASQGKTVDATAFHIRGQSGAVFGNRAWYVGATRARHELRIYTDDKDAALKAVGREQHKTSALEAIGQGREQQREGAARGYSR
ncbi:MAG: MobF family relaxase [Azonexus sp.]|jgi:conjugative relaxase-like TrwC/TraI family protein|nr:MobF family relaxase [Azonexus sp.]